MPEQLVGLLCLNEYSTPPQKETIYKVADRQNLVFLNRDQQMETVAHEAEFGISVLNELTFQSGRQLERMLGEGLPVLALRPQNGHILPPLGESNPLLLERQFGNRRDLFREVTRYAQVLRGQVEVLSRPLLKPRLATLENGIVHVDYKQHQTTVNGRNIPFTQTEFRIVSLLARNVGNVVSSEEIIARVWGPEYIDYSGYHLVRVNMTRIRGKIGERAEDSMIFHTCEGISGYSMVDFRPKTS